MTSEETINEINELIGAVDEKTLARVTRVVRLLHSYEWAVGELSILCSYSDEEYRRDRVAVIRDQLKKMIENEDEIVRKGERGVLILKRRDIVEGMVKI